MGSEMVLLDSVSFGSTDANSMAFSGKEIAIVSNDTSGIAMLVRCEHSFGGGGNAGKVTKVHLVRLTSRGALVRPDASKSSSQHLEVATEVSRPARRLVRALQGWVGYHVLEMDAAGHIASREYRIP